MQKRNFFQFWFIFPLLMCLLGLFYLSIGFLKYFHSSIQSNLWSLKHSYVWLGLFFLIIGISNLIMFVLKKIGK
jgi:hypothetical protein